MSFGTARASNRLAWLAVAAYMLGACTFPDFVVARGGPGGATAGSPGVGGLLTAGNAGRAGEGSGAAPTGGSGTSGTGAASEGGGSDGEVIEPVPVDIGPCGQRAHATHCYDHELGDDETDVDCGGPRCAPCAAEETCSVKRDCASKLCSAGKCERLFTLQYAQLVPDEETISFRLRAVLTYLGAQPLSLADVSVRYYFSRNNVAEPILPGGSVLSLPAKDDISAAATWSVVRQLRGNGIGNDAYLEISFAKGKILTQGQAIELDGSATTGDATSLFNQKTHHSFDPTATLHESKKLSVHVKGARVWGQGPAVDDPPSCTFLGVNLDGPAVVVDGNDWLASPDSVLSRYLNDAVAFTPAADKGHHDMLRAGFFFHDDTFTYPAENGSYALVAYAWSADGAETGTFKAQGEELDTFQATSFQGGGPWVPLGPYRITISDAKLVLAAKGDLRLGGIELRLLDE